MHFHPCHLEKSSPEFPRGGAMCGRTLIGGPDLQPLCHFYRFHCFDHMTSRAQCEAQAEINNNKTNLSTVPPHTSAAAFEDKVEKLEVRWKHHLW